MLNSAGHVRFLVCFSVSVFTSVESFRPRSEPWWAVRRKATSVRSRRPQRQHAGRPRVQSDHIYCSEAFSEVNTSQSFIFFITTSASHRQLWTQRDQLLWCIYHLCAQNCTTNDCFQTGFQTPTLSSAPQTHSIGGLLGCSNKVNVLKRFNHVILHVLLLILIGLQYDITAQHACAKTARKTSNSELRDVPTCQSHNHHSDYHMRRPAVWMWQNQPEELMLNSSTLICSSYRCIINLLKLPQE